MKPCHYIRDGARRVLIPGCFGTAGHCWSDRPMFYCTCHKRLKWSPIFKRKIERIEWRIENLRKRLRELVAAKHT